MFAAACILFDMHVHTDLIDSVQGVASTEGQQTGVDITSNSRVDVVFHKGTT